MNEISTTWVQGLKNPKCYSHSVDQVRLVETHISWVVLTGRYAYKIKKPVAFSFVDFLTLEKRRWFCEEEIRLNRRLAPDVYLGTVPISGSPTHPHIDGQGPPFEFAVKMKQFSSESEMHEILFGGKTAESTIIQLADRIAIFHAEIDKSKEDSSYGNPDRVWQAIKECFEEIPLHFLSHTTQKYMTTINSWLQEEWHRVHDVFLQRKKTGFVRECHGDLHLGNLAIFEGNVCVFDALEFEPRLRWIDVMSEIAFLVMDLQKNGRWDLAFVLLNRYVEQTGDYYGLAVFRLYQVYRALVRAKVIGLRIMQLENQNKDSKRVRQEMVAYLDLVNQLIKPPAPFLLLMHGVSGAGKTTLSIEVIKSLGSIRIRSDVERKRLGSDNRTTNSEAKVEADLYTSGMTQRTYDRLQELAGTLLQNGYSVVVDAAFLRQYQRHPFILLAKERGWPFIILDVVAPQTVLAQRIKGRLQEGQDASDATVEIMEHQQEAMESFMPEEQSHVIRVDSTDPESIVLAIKKLKRILEG